MRQAHSQSPLRLAGTQPSMLCRPNPRPQKSSRSKAIRSGACVAFVRRGGDALRCERRLPLRRWVQALVLALRRGLMANPVICPFAMGFLFSRTAIRYLSLASGRSYACIPMILLETKPLCVFECEVALFPLHGENIKPTTVLWRLELEPSAPSQPWPVGGCGGAAEWPYKKMPGRDEADQQA